MAILELSVAFLLFDLVVTEPHGHAVMQPRPWPLFGAHSFVSASYAEVSGPRSWRLVPNSRGSEPRVASAGLPYPGARSARGTYRAEVRTHFHPGGGRSHACVSAILVFQSRIHDSGSSLPVLPAGRFFAAMLIGSSTSQPATTSPPSARWHAHVLSSVHCLFALSPPWPRLRLRFPSGSLDPRLTAQACGDCRMRSSWLYVTASGARLIQSATARRCSGEVVCASPPRLCGHGTAWLR